MERLEGLYRADAAIVGGGLTGLLTASALAHAGLKVAVIDASDRPENPCAAAVPDAEQLRRIADSHSLEAARPFVRAMHAEQRELLARPLSYVRQTELYRYAATAADLPALEQFRALWGQLNLPCRTAPDAGGCPFPVELSLVEQAVPLVEVSAWMDALRQAILRRGGRIFGDSRVVDLEGTRVCGLEGCVDAGQVVLTCGKPPALRDRRLLALLESRRIAWCSLSSILPLHSCQVPVSGGITLLPGRSGILAICDLGRIGLRGQQQALACFSQRLHRSLPEHQQGGMHFRQEVRAADGLPVIGTLPGTHAHFAAGAVGVLGAMHAARVLTRRVLGQTLPEDALYAPDRALPRMLLAAQKRRTVAHLASGFLRRNAPACSNCRGPMRYSTAAALWECPVCGAAFTMLGQIAEGPAVRQARVSVRQRPDW